MSELIYEKSGLKLLKHIGVYLDIYYTVEFNDKVLRYCSDLDRATDCYSCKLFFLRSIGLIDA